MPCLVRAVDHEMRDRAVVDAAEEVVQVSAHVAVDVRVLPQIPRAVELREGGAGRTPLPDAVQVVVLEERRIVETAAREIFVAGAVEVGVEPAGRRAVLGAADAQVVLQGAGEVDLAAEVGIEREVGVGIEQEAAVLAALVRAVVGAVRGR